MSSGKKRYALLFIPSGVGGAEKMTMTIASFLNDASFRTGVCVISKIDALIRDFLPFGVEYYHLKAINQWDFVLWKLFLMIRREKPDVVFASHYYLIPKIIIAAKLAGCPRIVVRIPSSISLCDRLSRFFCRLTIGYADCVISQHEEMREEICKSFSLNPNKVISLNNPVNKEKINQMLVDAENPFFEKDTVNYISVARIHPVKGQDRLLKAFKTVHSHNPQARLFFIGDPGEGSQFNIQIQNYIRDNDLSECVNIYGYDNNPYRWMRYCDCLVLSSRNEGLPNVLIEAQYLGAPCVAIRCVPIIDRIISNGVNGYVVPEGDIDALGDAMGKAVNMGRVKMTYKSASVNDFVSIFKGCVD